MCEYNPLAFQTAPKNSFRMDEISRFNLLHAAQKEQALLFV
jgi:hypothetical protein